jgi:hypothetical protein
MSKPVNSTQSSTSANMPPPPPSSTVVVQNKPSSSDSSSGYRLPTNATLEYACKLAIVEDKAIMMDYWTFSIDKTVTIGVKEDGEKLLIKNKNEYTSKISKIFKPCTTEFVVMTENSIYVIDSEVPVRRLTTSM